MLLTELPVEDRLELEEIELPVEDMLDLDDDEEPV